MREWRASYPNPNTLSTACAEGGGKTKGGGNLVPAPSLSVHGRGRAGYLPVLTYWTHWPWFLNEEPSARFTFWKPPSLQSSLDVATRKGSKS